MTAMTDATLIATLSASPNGELSSLPKAVCALEVRADLAGDLNPEGLRNRFSGELIYSLRGRAEGGAFEGSPEERRRRLARAAENFDLVELGADDLDPQTLAAVPSGRRLISWHGPSAGLDGLTERWARLSSAEARLYRLAPQAARPEEGLAPLRLLKGLDRRDVLAYATGPAGTWTRVLAPRLGAPVVVGSLLGDNRGDGEPTVSQLMSDYGLPGLPPVRRSVRHRGPHGRQVPVAAPAQRRLPRAGDGGAVSALHRGGLRPGSGRTWWRGWTAWAGPWEGSP